MLDCDVIAVDVALEVCDVVPVVDRDEVWLVDGDVVLERFGMADVVVLVNVVV